LLAVITTFAAYVGSGASVPVPEDRISPVVPVALKLRLHGPPLGSRTP
jgi:hypothetical protein